MTADPSSPVRLLRAVRHVGAVDVLVDVLVGDGRVRAVTAAGTTRPHGVDEILDGEGRFLMRGLWDHHVHTHQTALRARRLDLGAAGSAAAVVRTVADAVPHHRGAAPLVGFGFRDGLWTDLPTTAALDAVCGLVPVVLISLDLHCGWLSSAALRRYGATLDASGLVREDALHAVLAQLDTLPEAEMDDAVTAVLATAADRGVVGVVDLEQTDNVGNWQRRCGAGFRAARVECGVYPVGLDATVEAGLRTGDPVAGTGGLVRTGPLKLFVDGSLNTRTALCHDPYPGTCGHGVAALAEVELREALARADRRGLEVAVHAIGDRANTLALDAFAATGAHGRIEHAQMVAAADVARFAELGVVASIQPRHAVDDRDVAAQYWAGRTDRAFPYADLHRASATLRLGSDSPVAPLDPWVTIAAAVCRTADDRPPWHPEQHLPVEVALAASTRGRPVVREGDDADLVLVDRDPATASPEQLVAMPVHATMVAGDWTKAPG